MRKQAASDEGITLQLQSMENSSSVTTEIETAVGKTQ